MIILLSPAKRMDFSSALPAVFHSENKGVMMSEPAFRKEAWQIARKMKEYNPFELAGLLHINPDLSIATAEKFASFQHDPPDFIVRPAIMAYKGDAYRGLDAGTFSSEDLLFAQDHLRILSALYGMLRPLDRMQAYRLEMGLPLRIGNRKNLYEFWKNKINACLKKEFSHNRPPLLINLASQEYFSVIDTEKLRIRVITPVFREYRDGTYKTLSMYAKYARGKMTRFIITHRISDPEEIKLFDEEGYAFDANLSEGDRWVFTRALRTP